MTPEPSARAAALEIRAVDPGSPLALAAVAAFLTEIDARLPAGFDIADALATDAASRDGARWVFLVATDPDSSGTAVLGGGVRELGPGIAEVKRMWVHPAWREVGLGARLLSRLEDEAAALGATTVRLDTHLDLREALALYERAGYREIPRYNDNPDAQAWFEKTLAAPTTKAPPGSAATSR